MADLNDNQYEDQYFQKQNAEARTQLREKLEAQAHEAASHARLAEEAELNDDVIVAHLNQLGFTADTAPALHLVPLVEVAWADGDVSVPERVRILRIAQAHGITPGSPAGDLLASLLEDRPSDEFFTVVRQHLHDLLEAQGLHPTTLLELCSSVAKVSGGFFGFGDKISEEEATAIQDLASQLNEPEADYVEKTNKS
ncbi:MAG: hypothetical protein AAF797_08995 [Planctomycetota bacterium]